MQWNWYWVVVGAHSVNQCCYLNRLCKYVCVRSASDRAIPPQCRAVRHAQLHLSSLLYNALKLVFMFAKSDVSLLTNYIKYNLSKLPESFSTCLFYDLITLQRCRLSLLCFFACASLFGPVSQFTARKSLVLSLVPSEWQCQYFWFKVQRTMELSLQWKYLPFFGIM